jgi:hypothetical protein
MPLLTALIAVLALQSTAGGQPSPEELALRTTSLELTVGIRGGFIGPVKSRIVHFGYDWNRASFRVVEWRCVPQGEPARPALRALDLELGRYRDFFECLLELGLDDLPLEDPPGGTDLYERNVGIRFSRGGKCWQNRANEGCVGYTSKVAPTAQQRLQFDSVIALVDRTLDALALEPASELDCWSPREWTAREICAMSSAVDLLRAQGWADSLNLNGVRILNAGTRELIFRFPWRNAQPLTFQGLPIEPRGGCEVAVGPGPLSVGPVLVEGPRGETGEDVERRRAFVAEHLELSAPHRDLILAGWIGNGMTEDMVIAAWGPPSVRDVNQQHVRMEFGRFDPAPRRGGPRLVTVEWIEGRIVMPLR